MHLVESLSLCLVDGHREGESDRELAASEGIATLLCITGCQVITVNVHERPGMWGGQKLALDVLNHLFSILVIDPYILAKFDNSQPRSIALSSINETIPQKNDDCSDSQSQSVRGHSRRRLLKRRQL